MAYRGRQSSNLILFLIGLNIVVLIFTSLSGNIFNHLALQPASFSEQPWTILTSMFVHDNFLADPWHIIFNMLTLYFFGTFLLGLVGEGKLLIIYFGGGILGNALFMLLAPSYSVVIGASGAIFSLGGALAILSPRVQVMVFPIPVPIPLWAAVIGGFLIVSFLPGVAWQAHLGGIIFGLVAGYIIRRRGRYF